MPQEDLDVSKITRDIPGLRRGGSAVDAAIAREHKRLPTGLAS